VEHINDARQRIEKLIYAFVYELASSSIDLVQASYYTQIVSADKGFISILQEIHRIDTTLVFERGYIE
jgi:hypothetical protein